MKSKKYKILFLSSWYPTKLSTQNGDFVQRHAKAVSEYCNVICFHVIKDKNLNSKLYIEEKQNGNFKELIYYFNCKYFSGLNYIHYYLKGYKNICKNYGKPQLVHANVLFPIGFIVFLFRILFKLPYIITEHWTGYAKGFYKKLPFIKRILYNYIGKKAKCLLPVTHDLKEEMIKAGVNGKFDVIPNVVETDIFAPGKKSQQEIKHILHVSNLNDEHKNVSGLLRVIEKLSKIRQDFVLDIIHSEENSQLYKLSDSLSIKDRFVNFLGKKSYEEVAKYMADSNILVLFSNYENLPCVIVEAFASGLPVVSTDVGGIKEHLNERMGKLLPKGDEEALFESINYMLDNYQKFDKEYLVNYAKTNFSYTSVGNQYVKIYSNIIDV